MKDKEALPNELLQHERERREWSREYVAGQIRAPEVRMVGRWEREGVLPHPEYRQRLCELFGKSARELGFVRRGEVPFWNVPNRRNRFFTGREDIIQLLEELLPCTAPVLKTSTQVQLPSPCALTGLGGIGKSQIALEYAYRYMYKYQTIVWLDARTQQTLISTYSAIAALVGLAERDWPDQEKIVAAVRAWLGQLSRWLLIFDSADDEEGMQRITDLIPDRCRGHVIITTRLSSVGQEAEGIAIGPMTVDEGATLLLRRAKAIKRADSHVSASPHERQQAEALAQQLGGLPLALDQAGAYVEDKGATLASYVQLYRDRLQQVKLLRRRGNYTGGYPDSVATTWSLSFDRIQKANPAAIELLHLLSFLHPQAIPEEVITKEAPLLGPLLSTIAGDLDALNEAFGELLRHSIVLRDGATGTCSMHSLVQIVVRDRMNEDVQRQWAQRAVLAVNRAFPEVEFATWTQCERLLPQAVTVAQWVEQYQLVNEEAGRLLHETATYLQSRARYPEAERFYQRALSFREQVLGSEHPLVASLLTGLADLYTEQGKYKLAEPLYQRALHIREQVLESGHPDLAEPLDGLGCLYTEQGKYKLAEPLYQRALQIREQAEHPLVAQPLHNLAFIYYKQSRYTEAEPLYQRAVHLLEQAKNPHVAYPLDGLANLYRKLGRYDEAEPLYQRALQIREQALGSEHPLLAPPLDGLADLYVELGRYDEAERLYQRALHILEQALRSGHPDVAYPLIGLANLYRKLGRYDEAEPLYRRALQIREQALGSEHPETAEVIHNIAIFQEAQGSKDVAKSLYDLALTVRKQALGADHPNTMETRNRLIALLHTMGQHEEATRPQATRSDP